MNDEEIPIQKPYTSFPENYQKQCECEFQIPDCSIGICYFEKDGNGLKRQMKYYPRTRYYCPNPKCGKELIKIKES